MAGRRHGIRIRCRFLLGATRRGAAAAAYCARGVPAYVTCSGTVLILRIYGMALLFVMGVADRLTSPTVDGGGLRLCLCAAYGSNALPFFRSGISFS